MLVVLSTMLLILAVAGCDDGTAECGDACSRISGDCGRQAAAFIEGIFGLTAGRIPAMGECRDACIDAYDSEEGRDVVECLNANESCTRCIPSDEPVS